MGGGFCPLNALGQLRVLYVLYENVCIISVRKQEPKKLMCIQAEYDFSLPCKALAFNKNGLGGEAPYTAEGQVRYSISHHHQHPVWVWGLLLGLLSGLAEPERKTLDCGAICCHNWANANYVYLHDPIVGRRAPMRR